MCAPHRAGKRTWPGSEVLVRGAVGGVMFVLEVWDTPQKIKASALVSPMVLVALSAILGGS